MNHLRPASRAVLAAFGLVLLSACAQSSPPSVIGHEEMRGGPLPATARVPVTGARPDIATEPMRGGSLPPAGSGALRRAAVGRAGAVRSGPHQEPDQPLAGACRPPGEDRHAAEVEAGGLSGGGGRPKGDGESGGDGVAHGVPF